MQGLPWAPAPSEAAAAGACSVQSVAYAKADTERGVKAICACLAQILSAEHPASSNTAILGSAQWAAAEQRLGGLSRNSLGCSAVPAESWQALLQSVAEAVCVSSSSKDSKRQEGERAADDAAAAAAAERAMQELLVCAGTDDGPRVFCL